MSLRVIKGDTFAPVCRYLTQKTRTPVNLTDNIVTINVRSADFKFSVELNAQPLDQSIPENKGRFLISPVDTSDWPVGTLVLKCSREQAGVKSSVTGSIVVEAG